jgi:hypothetical protein
LDASSFPAGMPLPEQDMASTADDIVTHGSLSHHNGVREEREQPMLLALGQKGGAWQRRDGEGNARRGESTDTKRAPREGTRRGVDRGEEARRKAPKRGRGTAREREMVRSNDGSGGRVDKGFNPLPAWGKRRESGDNVTGTTGGAAAFIYWLGSLKKRFSSVVWKSHLRLSPTRTCKPKMSLGGTLQPDSVDSNRQSK